MPDAPILADLLCPAVAVAFRRVMPLIIPSAVAAFVVTELIDPPPRASSGA